MPKYVEDCKYCQECKEKGDTAMPPHNASINCQSGKKDHCTCDTCY